MSIFDKNISQEKKASLEFAEEQREVEWKHPSFALNLFHGRNNPSLIYPFPQQSDEDKKIGDDYLKELADFLKNNLDPDEVDRTCEIPQHVYDGLGKLKAFAMKIPQKYGGMGLSQVNYNRAIHLVASYCGSTAVLLSAHQSIGVPQPLKVFGTEEQRQKYFPRFAAGTVSAFALTETEAGSDPRNMSTKAEPTEDGKHFIINGEKLWCTNGLVAGVIVVMAVTPSKMVHGKERKQITAFIVETDTPGFEIQHRCQFMGLHGIQNGLIRFNNVKVPRENIIAGEGEGLKLALTTLNTGRLTLPGASVGIAKWCLHVVRQWTTQRKQWGGFIGEHQSVALKLGYIASHTFAMDAMTWLTSHMADDKNKDIRLEAAIAKYFCTYHSWIICDETLQIRGGQGYENSSSLKKRGMHYWPVERVLRDVRINLIIEGTTEIMHLFIAREALDPYLSNVKPLFDPKVSVLKKLGILMSMNGSYLRQWLPLNQSYDKMHPKLQGHMNYVQASSRKLGRHIFHNMVRYQQKLESQQAILNRIVDIGTELFAMAASCSYAQSLIDKKALESNALDLADAYCAAARDRVQSFFRSSRKNYDRQYLGVAKKVMTQKYEWLENDIMT